MAYATPISQFIDEQLPDFIQDEAPIFADFLEAYYEYTEQSGNALEQLRDLATYQNIDEASSDFIDFFFQEVTKELPDSIRADRVIFIKHARELYEAKGSKNAYKFLFRLLYNSDVDLLYPGEKILRASDGRFDTQTKLRVDLTLNGNPLTGIGGETIIGSTNGGRAIVESVESELRGGITVFVLSLSNVTGTFADQEPFTVVNSTITGTVNSTFGPLADISIIDAGAQHVAGDLINIVSTQGVGVSGTARIATTRDDSAITFRVVKGGSGYRANVVYSTTLGGGKIIPAITGGTGQGASFRVVSITDTQNLELNTDFIAEVQNVKIGSDPFSSDPNIGDDVKPTFASSNAFSQLQHALTFETSGTIGAIDQIELIDPGFDYSELPTVTPVDHIVQDLIGTNFPDDTGVGGIKGANAVIVANNLFGAIGSVEILNPGSAYNKANVVELRNQTRANTFVSTGNPVPTGISNTVGVYTDSNRGILGGDNVLQDNYYYQEYSYVVKSKVGLNQYSSIVNGLLHPAGTKLFATQVIDIPITSPQIEVVSQNVVKEFDAIQIETTQVEVVLDVTRRADIQLGPAELPAVDIGPAHVDLRISDVGGIPSTAVVTSGSPGGGSPGEIEFVLFIEDANVGAPTTTVSTDHSVRFLINNIQPIVPDRNVDEIRDMEAVTINTVPFGSGPVGANVETLIASSNVESQLIEALTFRNNFGDLEVQIAIEEPLIPSGLVFGTASVNIAIEEVGGIASTVALGGQNPIEPMADVELNQNPFSNDPDIGASATSELAGSNINTTLNAALQPIVVSSA